VCHRRSLPDWRLHDHRQRAVSGSDATSTHALTHTGTSPQFSGTVNATQRPAGYEGTGGEQVEPTNHPAVPNPCQMQRRPTEYSGEPRGHRSSLPDESPACHCRLGAVRGVVAGQGFEPGKVRCLPAVIHAPRASPHPTSSAVQNESRPGPCVIAMISPRPGEVASGTGGRPSVVVFWWCR
jgi:hypothetical protein